MKPFRNLLGAVLLSGCFFAPACIAAPQGQISIGLVATSQNASIGNTPLTDGATIYSGDYVSTAEQGSLLLRFGTLSLELQGSSAAHVYQAPYGIIVELNHGTVSYTTPGNSRNIVIVANDVRVTPDLSLADLGRVSIDDPCDVTVYTQRGQANVQSGQESHELEEGKSFRVRAENEISYRQYLSPDASDYHKYHEHKPCAAAYQTIKGRPPIAPAQSRFIYVVGAVAIGVATVATLKALESPARP